MPDASLQRVLRRQPHFMMVPQMRTYGRKEEPVMFWMNFVTYVVIVVRTTAFGLRAISGRS
ncbi:MAG: hypothetical protein M9929_07940 [Burkholderiaceae bacterium]|nr:hypothetical protein [Burkholderiaceae bacterium]